MTKLTRYPLDTDSKPLDMEVHVVTDLTGNGGARLAAPVFGPDDAPIDAKGVLLVDISGLPIPLGDTLAANRTELASINGVSRKVAYLYESGREGQFVWDASNLSTQVAADTQQGVYVAPASVPSGASGAWVRKFDGKKLHLRWFGAVADGGVGTGTDNLAAMNAALAFMQTMSLNPTNTYDGPELHCAGWFYFSDNINLKQSIRLTGLNNSVGSLGTIFFFAAGKSGIIVNRANTLGESSVVASTTGADGAIIDGIAVWGNAGSTGRGFLMRAMATLRNCYARNFGLDGFHVYADAASGISGQANLCHFENCDAKYNGRHGFHFEGADSNVCTVIGCNAEGNGAWGFLDESFLGNEFFGCHATTNGLTNAVNALGVGVVNYGGTGYYAVLGQEVAAKTTQPGTNSAIWAPTGSLVGGAPTWVSGINVQSGGAYAGNNTNARSRFVGVYAEGGQTPCQFTSRAIIDGFLDEVTVVGGIWLQYGAGNRFLIHGGLETTGDTYLSGGHSFVSGSASYVGSSAANGNAGYFYRDNALGWVRVGAAGSTHCHYFVNDAGADVFKVAVGTQTVNFAGTISVGVNLSVTGTSLFTGTITAGTVNAGAISGTTGIFSGALTTVASGSGSAGLKLPHGSAPSSPANGDIWTTTAGLFARINGVTVAYTAGGTTTNAVTFNNGGAGAASGTTFDGSAARTISYNTVGAAPASPAINTPSASFTAADSDNNTHKVFSGASQTLTLNSTPAAGVSFTGRFTTAWAITCTSLSKNGAAPVSGGNIAANSLVTFLHEGSGTWSISGNGIT